MLTLSAIPITFDGDTHLRSDMVATVLDSAAVVQPFVPTGGATWTLTPGTGTYDPATDTTSYRVVLSGVPITFSPGDAQFHFSGDATIRATEWVSLAGRFITSLVLGHITPSPSPTTPPGLCLVSGVSVKGDGSPDISPSLFFAATGAPLVINNTIVDIATFAVPIANDGSWQSYLIQGVVYELTDLLAGIYRRTLLPIPLLSTADIADLMT